MTAIGPILTGTGLVTAFADNLEQTWEALLAGQTINTHSAAAAATSAGHPRVTQLALRAAQEAVEQARWGGDVLRDSRTALVVGTSRGPVNEWLSGTKPPPAIGIHTVAGAIAGDLRLTGPRLTFSVACASGLHALIRACMMLRSGEVDRAIIIGAEASLHPLFLACFSRLGVLPREGVGCRPFDVMREGFLVSEAAAAVCLQAVETGRPVAVVDRFAMGSDATTITAADGSGAVLRRMLRHVIDGRAVDLIHAHGTGTVANDPVELSAFDDECAAGDDRPIVYSHKAALGHSLGASGLVSVVLNCQMHRHGVVPGNVRTTNPIPTRRLSISTTPQTATIKRSLCLAAGFGGPVAAVSLMSPP